MTKWFEIFFARMQPVQDVAVLYAPSDKLVDDIADEIDFARRRKESRQCFRLRLEVHLQEQVLKADRYQGLLERLLAERNRP